MADKKELMDPQFCATIASDIYEHLRFSEVRNVQKKQHSAPLFSSSFWQLMCEILSFYLFHPLAGVETLSDIGAYVFCNEHYSVIANKFSQVIFGDC